MTTVKTLRYGYDGGGFGCGPIEVQYVTEAMFQKENGTTYFVSVTRLMEFVKVYVSEVSLYDIEMNIMNMDVDMDTEDEKLNKYSSEMYDCSIYELDDVNESANLKEIMFVLKANDYACSTDEDELMSAEDYIAEFEDVNIDELEIEFPEDDEE